MYRSLLVPLDGSEFGEHALPMALSLARRFGAALQVVRVHVPVWGVHAKRGTLYDETTARELREQDRAYLDKVIERLAAVADIAPSSALLDGPVADAISRHAAAIGADLLIMTTHGRGPLSRFWLGSVADAIVRQAPVPILLVQPQEAAMDLAKESVIRRVLIPLDGSELAERVVEPARALVDAPHAEYILLRVVNPPIKTGYVPGGARMSGISEPLLKQLFDLCQRQEKEAHDYLEQLAGRLRAQSLAVQTRVVLREQTAAAILDDAQKHGVDLIAMATQGQGGLKRLLLGSVADKVVRGAATPVLVYRVAQPNSTEKEAMKEQQQADSSTGLSLGATTAWDLMVSNPLSLRDQATVKEAIVFLTRNGFTAAPVTDEAGRPVGVVSQTNIVLHARDKIDRQLTAPDYYNKANLVLPAQEVTQGESLADGGDRTLVRDIMAPIVFAVAPETPAREVVGRMQALMVHRLFVVDAEGVLVGVISALDVLRHIR